jgi:death-on-curing protein
MTSQPEWKWGATDVVRAVHDQQLARHGGLEGVRDGNAVESALARPQNQAAYGMPDAANLAAGYCFGLARNHGFSDGNKRTAWIVARVFLADNGYAFEADPLDAIKTVEGVAAGNITEDELAAWFRQRIKR